MACLYPLKGWRSHALNPTGKRSIVFKHIEGIKSQGVTVPCGRCINCRLEKSRQWALRCEKESELYDSNCVVTLTYDDENLPENGSLNLADVQKFMKRLRKHYQGRNIRSYGCGEYGEQRARPHYHIILFNHDFEDKRPDLDMQKLEPQHQYWTSEILDSLWDMGRTQIMPLNFETAAYVARYVMKKHSGPEATRVKLNSLGSLVPVAHERSLAVSRRPGIGRDWYEKYKHTLCNSTIFSRGRPMRPPTFFDRRMEIDDPEQYAKVKLQRKIEYQKTIEKLKFEYLNGNYTNSAKLGYRPRMRAELTCKEAQLMQLKRKLI